MADDRLRCCGCGRFLPWPDCLPMCGASSTVIPDSAYSREEILYHCAYCTQQHGPPLSGQQFNEASR